MTATRGTRHWGQNGRVERQFGSVAYRVGLFRWRCAEHLPASSDSPPYLRRLADADDRLIRERYSARRSKRLRVVAPAFARSYGFLFSGPRQSELVSEVQCCLVQGQLVDRRPEVEHVSHRRALGMETTEHILAQVHRERSTAVCRLSVHRTRSTKLLASGVQL